jgi:hypothetical protein
MQSLGIYSQGIKSPFRVYQTRAKTQKFGSKHHLKYSGGSALFAQYTYKNHALKSSSFILKVSDLQVILWHNSYFPTYSNINGRAIEKDKPPSAT